jgi:hypothetical protein
MTVAIQKITVALDGWNKDQGKPCWMEVHVPKKFEAEGHRQRAQRRSY